MAALQYVDVPHYSALLLRRTYADLALPGALMDRAAEWLRPTAAKWREQDKTWTFPSGATLTFGYLETENDKYRYQGSEFQFVGFDELTQFTQTQFQYLFSRLRRHRGVDIPIRMRAASNPGGIGHDWVFQRYLVEGPAKGRIFVPARLEDNPHLDREEYEQALNELDPVTRARLRNGDWNVRESGGYFKREWFKIVDRAPPRLHWVRCWDLAGTEPSRSNPDPDWTAGVLLAEDQGTYWIRDVRRRRLNPGGVEGFVKATAEEDGKGVEVRLEQEPGSSGKAVVERYEREVLKGYVVRGKPSTGDKVERAKPFSAAVYNGNVNLVRGPWLSDYLDELEAFPAGGHDDMVDATSGAFDAVQGGSDWAPTVAPSDVRTREL
jgi:predicted phage terminase large subunit-like protein